MQKQLFNVKNVDVHDWQNVPNIVLLKYLEIRRRSLLDQILGTSLKTVVTSSNRTTHDRIANRTFQRMLYYHVGGWI